MASQPTSTAIPRPSAYYTSTHPSMSDGPSANNRSSTSRPNDGMAMQVDDLMMRPDDNGSSDEEESEYFPPEEEDPEDEEEDDDDDEDMEFAAEDQDDGNVNIEFVVEGASPSPGADGQENDQQRRPNVRSYTTRQMIQLLGAGRLQSLLRAHGVIGQGLGRIVDSDEDSDDAIHANFRRRRTRKVKNVEDLYPKSMIPSVSSSSPQHIIHYDSRAYSGQFSDDGNFFFSCAQDFNVRMYDTSNPYQWKYYKTVNYPLGQWTITDASLSPDNKYLAYSSIRHIVCLAPTDPGNDADPMLLDLTNFSDRSSTRASRRGGGWGYRSGFGIMSIRFSGDGREIVAGTTDHTVVVYDIERRQSILNLQNHDDDVNAVCFGDKSSPHILYSGSDDATIRVWDRRSMGDGREAGIFTGHTEGLTYVDSKGDGRYVLSNGKDQVMKLWDLRKMCSSQEFEANGYARCRGDFDYRFSDYEPTDESLHPKDMSVVTFRGHSVLKTLIRCHFSPPGSTDSRYVYSGSKDGNVWIWNMDGTVRGKIDVLAATKGSRARHSSVVSALYDGGDGQGSWSTCVRDASWHPNVPVLAATCWNGYNMSAGTCSLHAWDEGLGDDEGEPKMGINYDSRLNVKEETGRGGRRRRY
ncbi:MAG: hypothetical protein Q9227_001771 [Pyrenula ochraceoflavens]